MATLYVTEFQSAVAGIGSFVAPVLPQPALAQQNLVVGAASNPSVAFSAKTNAIEIYADVACTFIIGAGPTVPVAVVLGGNRMAMGERRVYAVPPGGFISVIN